MIKTLTQDVFKDAPEWVESVAVDEDSYLWGYVVGTLFLSIDDNGDKWIANFGKSVCLGNEYDTTEVRQVKLTAVKILKGGKKVIMIKI